MLRQLRGLGLIGLMTAGFGLAATTGVPGTLNYVEGQVSINGEQLKVGGFGIVGSGSGPRNEPW